MAENSKEKFLKIYVNLPVSFREEVILVLDISDKKTPITWNSAYIEVKNNTKLGDLILKKLEELEII